MTRGKSTYEHLRDRLISGEFYPGQRMKYEDLRADYGISISSVRETLFRLSAVGLVDFLEQRGFRVPHETEALRHDLAQSRILLETEGACLSIRYGGVGWEARLNAAHHELKHIESRVSSASGNSQDLVPLWSAAELKFHRTLIEECRSEVLKQLHLQVYYRFRQQLISHDKNFGFITTNVEQHQGILEAALLHDEALTRERIHQHLSRHLIQLPPQTDSNE
ncbi:GntR family transcriptional regulator [Leucothrix pacifica]|uniref:GntR family transcriptional regulator n=1 Tax=Leucothrix pacifica TaxID=1247513 RepID=A0A317CLE0_9GAMM|nr:GntR family transcriptional regulator [Leucothrix pacifica]PWQ99395.1 GntR family transcriptional regulator [Leucothrix pacifica]